jgi:hypothetical protein
MWSLQGLPDEGASDAPCGPFSTVDADGICDAPGGRRHHERFTVELDMSDLSLTPNLPQWWNDRIAAAWRRSRDAAVSDWKIRGDRSSPMDGSIVEHALAFGHGARSAYSRCATWDDVCPYLRADWTRLGNIGLASWDKVAGIVQHEWLRAAAPGGDAAPA